MSEPTPTTGTTPDSEPETLSPYDREAALEIAELKDPEGGLLSRVADAVHRPLDKLADAAFDTKVGEAVDDALSKVIELLQAGSTWTIREEKILADFRDDGHPVQAFDDIAELGLETVDDVVGNLGRKYRILAMVEGTAIGAVGAAGVAIDIPLILGIAIRGATEAAGYYGFFPFTDEEKGYVLDLVSTAASPTREMRRTSLAALDDAGRDLATGRRAEAETVLAIQAVERLAESIVARMARGKVAQGVPLVGAFIGGGFNRWFVGQVMQLAEAMYRERFLIRRYGADAVRRAQGAA